MYQYPVQVAWEVTGRCNLNCLYCLNHSGEKRSELSASERIRFAKEIVSGGVMDVTISGGEPLLLPEIFELLKIFKDGGVKITFLTNGLLLNDDACCRLKDLVDVIQISLDTLDPDIFRELSNLNVDLKKVLDGIVNAVRHGLPLVIGSVVNKLNCREISGIAEFCLRSGIKQYSLSEMMMMGRARGNKDRLLIGEAERLKIYEQVERYKGLLKITAHEPCISFRFAEKKNNVCDCSLVSCSVAYTGAQPLPAPLLSQMLKLGYKTIIVTHIFPDTKKAIPKHPLNYVLLGHMPADSLGMNLLLAHISSRECLNIIPCGGFEPSIFPCI